MSLTPGTRLGSYEVIAPIGAGGMGEVFRARDTKLGRDVAIKVLPAAFADEPERLARFEHEARALAALNHTNIAHVYGFESAALPDGLTAHFLAMEMVEGEDLAERLKRGAIPADEAMTIAKQIAEGLEEAHEKGIVHRDLKPANVKLTPDGKVKVLDFGLAKAYSPDPVGSGSRVAELVEALASPTLTRQGTEAGMIMGTAAYMSPEQARGKSVDKRADIWAFGVVLYEMLTGARLFKGETVSDTLAAVLMKDPDLSLVPRRVRGLIGRCLERDPRKRLRDLGDVWLLVDEHGSTSVRPGPARLAPSPDPGSLKGTSPKCDGIPRQSQSAEARVWLLDTSVWIEVFRKNKPFDLSKIGGLDEVVTCLPVIQEVLQGFRDEAAFRVAKEAMLALPCVDSPLRAERFEEAASLYRASRRAGVTVRSSVDCLIAACAIHNGLGVLHSARDFTGLARVSPLIERNVAR